MKAGVIDPAKVVRSALQNASSIASLLLTTEALISEIPEAKPDASMARRSGRRHGCHVLGLRPALDSFSRREHMWFIIGILVGLTTTAMLFRLTLPIVHAANLGWMSE